MNRSGGERDAVVGDDLGRPSLYGNASADGTTEMCSMLDALESPKRSALVLRMLTVLLLAAMVISIAAVVVSRNGYAIPIKTWIETNLRGQIKKSSAQTLSTTPPHNQISSSRDPGPAAILDEAPTKESPHEKPVASLGTEAEPMTPSQVSAQPTHNAEKVSSAADTQGKPAPEKKIGSKKREAKKHEAKTMASGSSGMKKEKNGSKDKDVDLIAALLSHVVHSRAGSASEKGSGISGVSTVSKRAQEPARDIVLQSSGESTESLVRRCQNLGFLEGQLCRIRICSGLWGVDPACPKSVNSSAE